MKFAIFGLFLSFVGALGVDDEEISIDMIPANGSLNVLVDDNVTLSCKITAGPPDTAITWERGPSWITVETREDLTFERVKLEDAGEYRCNASNGGGNDTLGYFMLNVNETEPIIETIPSNGTIVSNLGKNVSFWCKIIQGSPRPNVTWEKSPNWTFVGVGEELSLNQIELEDTGTYRCNVTNGVGDDQAEYFNLDVFEKEPIIEMVPANGTVDVIAGENATIRCIVIEGVPPPNVTWIKNSGVPIDDGEELSFISATHEDAGIYQCTASNGVGKDATGSFTFDVYEFEELTFFAADEGRLVNHQLLNGETLTWYDTTVMPGEVPDVVNKVAEWTVDTKTSDDIKGGYEVDDTTGDLLIKPVKLTNEGCYTAIMKSSQGEHKYNFSRLTVFVSPKDVVISGVDIPINYTEINGGPTEVNCTAPNVKPENVSFIWSLSGYGDIKDEGSIITKNDDGTWKVVNIVKHGFNKTDNDEKLTCEVRHGVDSDRKEADEKTITVYYPYEMQTKAHDHSKLPLKGDDFKLECTAVQKGNPADDKYYWYKNLVYSKPLTDRSKYSGYNTPNLTIKKLEASDDGEYECKLLTDAGMSETVNRYTLSVSYAPVITLGCPSIVKKGDYTQIICTITEANPAVEDSDIRWYYNGTDSHVTGSTYTLGRADTEDNGVYRCTAKNKIGNSSQSCIVDVFYLYKARTEEKKEYEFPIRGKSKTLQCIVDEEGHPNTIKYSWYKDNDQTPLKDKNKYRGADTPELTILKLAKDDVGKYHCGIKNDAGMTSGVSKYSLNDVFYGPSMTMDCPSEVEEGEYVRVTCTADANPQITTREWRHNGEFIHSGSSDHWSFHGYRSDGGTYTCSSMNRFGHAASSCYLDILHPPEWNKRTTKEQFSELNETKILLCDVDAWPTPHKYDWTFEGEKLRNETGRELRIDRVTSKNIGTYICMAINTVKNKEHNATFEITLEEKGPPVFHDAIYTHLTSRTLRLLWRLRFDGGYEIMVYELVVWQENEVVSTFSIRSGTCTYAQYDCYVLKNLEPRTKYRLESRGKNKRPNDDSWSNIMITVVTTDAAPDIKLLKPVVKKDNILVKWTFTGRGVSVGINYKEDGPNLWRRYPDNENERIPASYNNATIIGKFDPSSTYLIRLIVYENGYQTMEVKPEDEPSQAAGAIVGSVFGTIFFMVLVGVIAVVLIKRNDNISGKISGFFSKGEGDSGIRQSTPKIEMNIYENVSNRQSIAEEANSDYWDLPVRESIASHVLSEQLVIGVEKEEFNLEIWLKENNISSNIAKKLTSQGVSTQADLCQLTSQNIGRMKIKIGDENRLVAAIQVLRYKEISKQRSPTQESPSGSGGAVTTDLQNDDFDIETWLKDKNVSNHAIKKLMGQGILTIQDLRLLTKQNLEKMKIKIGDENRLVAGIRTLAKVDDYARQQPSHSQDPAYISLHQTSAPNPSTAATANEPNYYNL